MTSVQEIFVLLRDKLASWIQAFFLLLPNLIIAVLILMAARYIAKKVQALVKNLLGRFIDNHALVNFLSGFVYVGILLLGALIAIKIVKLDQVVFSVLAGVGIVGIAVGFAFQDIAANFIAGIALVFRKDYPFRVGDIVETNGYMGVVKEICLRDTMLQTFTGQMIFIPNKLIFENSVNNYSLLKRRRVDVAVGISYGDDLAKVERITREAVRTIDNRMYNEDVGFFYEEFGDSSINFVVNFWIPFVQQADYLRARSKAIMNIKKAYDENDITIPFPIRTLDFGIKGGEKLSDVLPKRK